MMKGLMIGILLFSSVLIVLSPPVSGDSDENDLITDALSYSGIDWWDGEWKTPLYDGVFSPVYALEGTDKRVGSYSIDITHPTGGWFIFAYYFDAPISLERYSYFGLWIKDLYMIDAGEPLFYSRIELTDSAGKDAKFYIPNADLESNDWFWFEAIIQDADVIEDGFDIDDVEIMTFAISHEAFNGDTQHMRVDGLNLYISEIDPSFNSDAEKIDALIPIIISVMGVVIVVGVLGNGLIRSMNRIFRRMGG